MSQHNEKSIKEAIADMLKAYRLKDGVNLVRLRSEWEKIAGTLIANHTKELKLSNKRLYVTLDSAPLKQELFYRRSELVKLLNDAFGNSFVEEIQFI
jgi:predicted nucleic acid-binding Zn ribbon protein